MICSRSGKYCARTDPRDGTVGYEMQNGSPGQKLWTLPGWYEVAALADDGKHFVTGYDGMNLIPIRFDPNMVMIRFHRSGTPIAEVRLNEMVNDLGKLRLTTSHRLWGNYASDLDDEGLFSVSTVEGRRLWFDATTGHVVKTAPDASYLDPEPARSSAPEEPPRRSCACTMTERASRGQWFALGVLGLALALRRRRGKG